VVKAFERGAECPTSDPIRVYRLGPSGWELEASFTHRSGFISNIEIDNDTLVIAEDPSFSNREGRIRVYRRANRAWTLEDEFGQNDPEPWDFFGRSIALDGDTLAVGAPNEGSGSTFGRPVDGPGAVYVFRRSGSSWSQIDKIGDGDRAGDRTGRLDQFGRQVDVIEHGGRARVMVSAPLHRPDEFTASGVVMLFDENDGFDDYQLYGSDEADDSGFGYQLTLSDGVAGIASLGRLRLYRFDGDRLRLWETVNIERDSINRLDSEGEVIAVGRPFRDDLGPVTGSISIWDWGPINGFVTVVREAVTDLEDGDQYGAQVVIGGGFFHVGVPFHDFAGPDTGAVYSYGLDSTPTEPRGSLASKFFTGDAVPGARFAEDLDTDGARMIAGLPGNVPCPTGRGGSAFIYTLQDQVWSREQNLAVEDVDPDARFGAAVSVYGDTAAVGAPADGPNDTGSVHIFERSHLGWSRVARLVPSQARGGEGFGWDIDLQAGRITIGVPGGWTGNERTGYAITYTRTAQGWLPESRLALPSGF
ncbi:MAG: FG-GAP repeat protein, partial [Planctomycetota bacterium]